MAFDGAVKKLEAAGASKTVYALVMPETERAVDRILDGESGLGRERFRDMYRHAWTHKQDAAHKEFFDTWRRWTAPVLKGTEQFPQAYPAAGASEPLREAIHMHGHRGRRENFDPVIHVFEGEYEGYSAYAEGAGIPVVKHDRAKWWETLGKIGRHDEFYISQPSAIDGNVWPEFGDFTRALQKAQPEARVMLDVTYVGAVAKPFEIDAGKPNIHSLFFSLSKPFGAYYHRVGGMLSREEVPGLWGNMWFKNLLSLKLGTEMMKKHGVFDLPRKYSALAQAPAAAAVSRRLGVEVVPSDVYLLGTVKPSAPPSELETLLLRGSGEGALARVCLTPEMFNRIAAPKWPGGKILRALKGMMP